jgi:hypothetical protein
MGEACGMHDERKKAYRVFVREADVKGSLGKPRCIEHKTDNRTDGRMDGWING